MPLIRIDVTGQRFGLLTVLGFSHSAKNSMWKCKCDCGNELVVPLSNLRSGNTTKCNASLHREGIGLNDLTGQSFGRLTVTSRNKETKWKGFRVFWNCVCNCGNDKVIVVEAGNLKSGHTNSCGCYMRDQVSTHGCFTRDWRLAHTWQGMMARCYNPQHKSYKNYGGRGIDVCKAWHDPNAFLDWAYSCPEYSPNLSIERLRVNEGYYPTNCTWIPLNKQARNTRVSLGEEAAIAIRSDLSNGMKPKDAASKYHCAYTTIIAIKNYDNYKDI